jgi:hypothetical protein
MPISLFLNEKFIKFAHEKAIKVEHMNEKLILSEDGKAVLEADHSIIHAVIPEGVTKIGKDSFNGSQISSVIIPEGVEEIGYGAFRNTYKLSEVQLPHSLKIIGDTAFAATGLVSLHIPEGVTEIGGAAFFNSRALRHISIPSTVNKILNPFMAVELHDAHIYVRDLERLEIVGHINCKYLYVPSGMLEAYKRHPVFGEIENIVEIE